MRTLLLACLFVSLSAGAQSDYRNKPVRLAVSFAAGGISNVLAPLAWRSSVCAIRWS